MPEREVDSVMLHSIETKMNEAEVARGEVLHGLAMLNQKYDSDKAHVDRRLKSLEDWKKYTTRGLIAILIGIIISVCTSVTGMVMAQKDNSANDEIVKLMIQEFRLLREQSSISKTP